MHLSWDEVEAKASRLRKRLVVRIPTLKGKKGNFDYFFRVTEASLTKVDGPTSEKRKSFMVGRKENLVLPLVTKGNKKTYERISKRNWDRTDCGKEYQLVSPLDGECLGAAEFTSIFPKNGGETPSQRASPSAGGRTSASPPGQTPSPGTSTRAASSGVRAGAAPTTSSSQRVQKLDGRAGVTFSSPISSQVVFNESGGDEETPDEASGNVTDESTAQAEVPVIDLSPVVQNDRREEDPLGDGVIVSQGGTAIGLLDNGGNRDEADSDSGPPKPELIASQGGTTIGFLDSGGNREEVSTDSGPPLPELISSQGGTTIGFLDSGGNGENAGSGSGPPPKGQRVGNDGRTPLFFTPRTFYGNKNRLNPRTLNPSDFPSLIDEAGRIREAFLNPQPEETTETVVGGSQRADEGVRSASPARKGSPTFAPNYIPISQSLHPSSVAFWRRLTYDVSSGAADSEDETGTDDQRAASGSGRVTPALVVSPAPSSNTSAVNTLVDLRNDAGEPDVEYDPRAVLEVLLPPPDIPVDMLLSNKIQLMGKALAEIDNLMAAKVRHVNLIADGRPPVVPLAKAFQCPSMATVATEEMVAKLNSIMMACAVECSQVLVRAEEKAEYELREKVAKMAEEWGGRIEPNELAAIVRVKESRLDRIHQTAGGPKDPFVFFELAGIGEKRSIVPHPSGQRAGTSGDKIPGKTKGAKATKVTKDAKATEAPANKPARKKKAKKKTSAGTQEQRTGETSERPLRNANQSQRAVGDGVRASADKRKDPGKGGATGSNTPVQPLNQRAVGDGGRVPTATNTTQRAGPTSGRSGAVGRVPPAPTHVSSQRAGPTGGRATQNSGRRAAPSGVRTNANWRSYQANQGAQRDLRQNSGPSGNGQGWTWRERPPNVGVTGVQAGTLRWTGMSWMPRMDVPPPLIPQGVGRTGQSGGSSLWTRR